MATEVVTDSGKARDPYVLTDDTEEDLVGTDLHQRAIRTLCENLLHVQEKRGTPWHVGMQLTTLMGDVPGKRDWRPSPDILVHLTAGPGNLSSLDAVALGAPHLVVEVLSESTWGRDVDRKKEAYWHAGVEEYLIFDPTTTHLGTDVQAWRRASRSFVPWRASAGSRWHSRVIDVTFRPQGMLLRVTDRDGQVMPTLGEAVHLAERERLAAEQERLAAEQERLAAEQERLAAGQERRRADEAVRLVEQERRRADEAVRLVEQERRAMEQERRRADEAVRLAEEQTRHIAALQAALEARQHGEEGA